jgi:hypothetical protein
MPKQIAYNQRASQIRKYTEKKKNNLKNFLILIWKQFFKILKKG